MSDERNRFSLKAKKHKNDILLSIVINSRSCAHLFLLSFEWRMVVFLGELNKNFLEQKKIYNLACLCEIRSINQN